MFSRLSGNAGRKLLLNKNISVQQLGKCKFSRLAFGMTNVVARNDSVLSFHKHSKVIGMCFVRYESTVDATKETVLSKPLDPSPTEVPKTDTASTTVIQNNVDSTVGGSPEKLYISDLPDIPTPIPDGLTESVMQFHPNGEATFASLGLTGWTPVGLIQSCFEWAHITCGIPWWGTIVLGTLCARLILFPLVVISQRSIGHANKHLPELQEIQMKMSEARQYGNEYEASMYGDQLFKFMKKNNISPMKNFIVIGAQAPIFISFFIALRRMANVPVESLKTGGLWWFTDLTVPDPYYLLPVITSATMLLTLEIGALSVTSPNNAIMKYLLRGMPFVAVPFMLNFPSAILCYWTSTNFISLFQVGMLKIPSIRRFFNIPVPVKQNTSKQAIKSKGFKEGLQESWTNIKISRQLAEKSRADVLQFNQAAKGPIRKTYKYDPTKNAPAAAILTKKR